ncbi:MAG: tRNA 4-thiouridine(8) synthase ThiI [Patescibacteria group bacterium]|nr:tRNA 4-thiouridine(8) synthase ThiI [Patescibacteria group bacterium]
MQTIIIHYSEIGLKGRNRNIFENKLIKNIKAHIDQLGSFKLVHLHDRILFEQQDSSDISKIKTSLLHVFGISNFSFANSIPLDFEEIKKQTITIAQKNKFTTFAIKTNRINKKFKISSQHVNEQIGGVILDNFKNKKVKLKNPDLTIYIDILYDQALIYSEKIKACGGLPTETAGNVISLISGGIDSPVASYQIMKRGCQIIFCHFHSYPQTSKESQDQVKKLVSILDQYQQNSKLYLIPILDLQKQIVAKCSAKLRVILYRRMMMRIATKITEQENAKALVTGDSIGQVASQTLENIQAVSQSTNLPIFRPLAGLDKEEIINIANKIDTYQTSIQPFGDCCSLFVPDSPETKARLEEVIKNEQELEIDALIKKSLDQLVIKQF